MTTRLSTRFVLSLLLLAAILAGGCQRTELTVLPNTGRDAVAATVQSLLNTTAAPTAALPSLTPQPSATTPATLTPLPTDTPFPTLTPTPTLHPMMIDAARQTPYPGSPIVIEQELDRGANYRRYYAWYMSEGLQIYGLLTVPDGEMPATGWPAIVFNHGYIPPDVYKTTERYIAYVDWLARSGYIVFRIDYRGHDRSEGEASGAYSAPGYTADVLNAVAAIQQYPQADPNRIGMWGHSMGGYLTLRSMVISPDVKVGVIWAGVVASYPDLLTRWRSNRPTPTPDATGATAVPRGWRGGWMAEFGTPEENPAFWLGVSANSYLPDLQGRPIQLHHAYDDHDVPVEFSEILHEEMLAAGQVSELYLYEDDNHNISENFGAAMTRTIQFFDQYLK